MTLPGHAEDGDAGPVRMTVGSGDNRSLTYELIVPAGRDAVWDALMTTDGLETWAGPAALVEPRRGGAWDVYFDPDAPKGQRGSENTLIAIVPKRLIVMSAGAPKQFETVNRERTIVIFETEAADEGRTLVRMIQTGWGEGPDWDGAFEYVKPANAEWLSWLHRRFESGPLEWPEP